MFKSLQTVAKHNSLDTSRKPITIIVGEPGPFNGWNERLYQSLKPIANVLLQVHVNNPEFQPNSIEAQKQVKSTSTKGVKYINVKVYQ